MPNCPIVAAAGRPVHGKRKSEGGSGSARPLDDRNHTRDLQPRRADAAPDGLANLRRVSCPIPGVEARRSAGFLRCKGSLESG